jgi:L-cysteine desulfidase
MATQKASITLPDMLDRGIPSLCDEYQGIVCDSDAEANAPKVVDALRAAFISTFSGNPRASITISKSFHV